MNDFEFFKYINESSILVITKKKELKRLYCPFAVIDSKNNISNVVAVASTNKNEIRYLINGKYQSYSNYRIMN